MSQFLFILQSVSPVFIITFLGILFKKIRLIDQPFIDVSTNLVFKVVLPCLIFSKISQIKFQQDFFPGQIAFVVIGTVITCVLVWIMSRPLIKNCADRASFIQGAFRSNFAIVGFAIIGFLFGEEALGQAAILLAFIMPLYNLLAVLVLTMTTRKQCGIEIHSFSTLLQILKNPLIIAAFLALPFALLKIPVPSFLDRTIQYFAYMALPLALLAIGGSLNLAALKEASRLAFIASLLKLIVLPALLIVPAIFLGYRHATLGVMVVLFSSPSAVAGFVMAKSMGANAKLAGNIILISTLGASITMALWISILTQLHLM